jgi:uncharacterized membrane protein
MTIVSSDGTVIVAKHNNSLSPQGFVWLFASIVLIATIVAIGVGLSGAWLVLPFAGIELIAFAWAFHHVIVHYGDFDRISLIGNEVVVEKRNDKNSQKFTFERYWAKVILRNSDDGTCSIFIGSHGKEVEFGSRYMDQDQRIMVAKQLKTQLKIV